VTNKPAIKIALYLLLCLGVVIFFSLFIRDFSRIKRKDVTETPAVLQAEEGTTAATAPAATQQGGHAMLYLALLLACAIPLGLLIAKDVTAFTSQQALDFVFNDDGDGTHNADYEAAEMEVTRGNVLDAINMMRACYEKYPRELYIVLRIAELYEVNLRNHLAAALEYEEIIKKKLPSERWGWAAIHLANLYSGKLNRPDDAIALLHRIVAEHPKTGAAKKARERLGLPEDAPVPPAGAPLTGTAASALPAGFAPKGSRDHAAPASETAEAPEPVVEEVPAPALPSGFRPRSTDEDTTFIAPASETMTPAARPDRSAVPAPNLPPGFRPKG
jgi:tetratricopeptide (TPR) repeat protein